MAAAVATVTVLIVMSTIFWALAHTEPAPDTAATQADAVASSEPTPVPTPTPEPTPEPTQAAAEAPPAPASNVLSSNDWLLSPYAIIREQGDVVVTGTLKNKGTDARSASIRVYVYGSGALIGTGKGQVRDVAAGESLEVSLPTDSAWVAGDKVLLVEVTDID